MLFNPRVTCLVEWVIVEFPALPHSSSSQVSQGPDSHFLSQGPPMLIRHLLYKQNVAEKSLRSPTPNPQEVWVASACELSKLCVTT